MVEVILNQKRSEALVLGAEDLNDPNSDYPSFR
jgi:hypothetical protein